MLNIWLWMASGKQCRLIVLLSLALGAPSLGFAAEITSDECSAIRAMVADLAEINHETVQANLEYSKEKLGVMISLGPEGMGIIEIINRLDEIRDIDRTMDTEKVVAGITALNRVCSNR